MRPDDRRLPGPSGPAAELDEDDLRRLFHMWVSSDLKLQVLAFFRDNPGVVETPEGLARRLGVSFGALRNEIASHLELGILEERRAGSRTILVFDRGRHESLRGLLRDHLGTLRGRAVP